MYLSQEQQGMVKKVLVMRQQHCGTPYQTMQGVFPLLGSSQFSSLSSISQKIVLVAHVSCDLLSLPQNYAYVLCLSLCFYLCMRFYCYETVFHDLCKYICLQYYKKAALCYLRDRPFNLKRGGGVIVFCFVQNFFFGQHKS